MSEQEMRDGYEQYKQDEATAEIHQREAKESVRECFDDLQDICERTASLLKTRENGLMAWNMLLRTNLLELRDALKSLGVPWE